MRTEGAASRDRHAHRAHQDGDDTFRTTLECSISLASRGADLFERSNIDEKRQLLAFVFSNLNLRSQTLEVSMRSPFDLMVGREEYPRWLCRQSRANLSPPNFPIITGNGQGILRELTRQRSKERETIVVRMGERPKKAVFTARRSQASAPRVFDSACSALGSASRSVRKAVEEIVRALREAATWRTRSVDPILAMAPPGPGPRPFVPTGPGNAGDLETRSPAS